MFLPNEHQLDFEISSTLIRNCRYLKTVFVNRPHEHEPEFSRPRAKGFAQPPPPPPCTCRCKSRKVLVSPPPLLLPLLSRLPVDTLSCVPREYLSNCVFDGDQTPSRTRHKKEESSCVEFSLSPKCLAQRERERGEKISRSGKKAV